MLSTSQDERQLRRIFADGKWKDSLPGYKTSVDVIPDMNITQMVLWLQSAPMYHYFNKKLLLMTFA